MELNIPSTFVLDTNVALYYLGGRLVNSLPVGQHVISIVSEMELLSYPSLSTVEEEQIQNFMAQLSVINISDDIKQTAVQLRRQHRLKLPDAIIAATAESLDATLLTNDSQLIRLEKLKTQMMQLL